MSMSLAEIFGKKSKKDDIKKTGAISKTEAIPKQKTKKTISRKKTTKTTIISLEDIKKAVREVLLESNITARKLEATEENIVRAVWDSEPAGIKYDSLAEHFQPLQARKVFELLLNLEERNILIRDRNGWYHVNPRFMEQVLEHYGIQYDPRLPSILRQRIAHRISFRNINEPRW